MASNISPRKEDCEKFGDFTIIAKDGRSIFGDRLVVASRIPTLKDLLRDVSPGGKLKWSCFTYENIDAWMSYAFTGKLEITTKNALELYLMAVIFKDVNIQTECWQILLKSLTVDTVSKLAMLASYSGEKSFSGDCVQFINTKLIVSEAARNELLASLEVNGISLLLNDEPVLDTKLNLMAEWMHLVRDRYSDIELLNSLTKLAGSVDWTFSNSSLITDHLMDFSEEFRTAVTKKLDEQPHINLVTISDRANIEMFAYVLRMNPLNAMHYSHQMKLPFIHRFGIVEAYGIVYMIGGYVGKSIDEVYRIDIIRNKFRQVDSMISARTNASCITSKEEIFVCGGTVDDEIMLKSCEVYNLETEKWTALPDMHEPRMKCEVIWMSNGMIYAIGGMNNTERLASVEGLPRAWTGASSSDAPAKWRLLAPMKVTRNFFCSAVVKGQIVVCGGFTGDVGAMPKTVEMFAPPKTDKELGQWTSICDFNFPEPILSAYFREDNLYLLYGTGYDIWKLKPEKIGSEGKKEFEFGDFAKYSWNVNVSNEYYTREAIVVDTKRFQTA